MGFYSRLPEKMQSRYAICKRTAFLQQPSRFCCLEEFIWQGQDSERKMGPQDTVRKMSRILATSVRECFSVPSFTVLSIDLISRKERRVCYGHFLTVPDPSNLVMDSPDTQ